MNKKLVLFLLLIISCFCFYKIFVKSDKLDIFYIENIGGDYITLDPQQRDGENSIRIMYDLFDPLFEINQKTELKPGVAEKYEISDDYKTYTFYLRKNLKWSNGDPLTAHDFEYSFKRLVNPKTISQNYAFLMDNVENGLDIQKGIKDVNTLGVKSINNQTLEIKLLTPDPSFIYKMTLIGAYPVPSKIIEKYGNNWTDIDKIATNGAYKISKIVHNGYVELEKNPYYWDKNNVKINKVKFLMISDANSDVQSFKTNANYCTYINLPPNDVDYYKKTYGDQLRVYSVLDQERLTINFKNEKFQDVRVRKALSMAIDREKLTKYVVKMGTPSYSVVLDDIYQGYLKDIYNQMDDYNWINKSMEEKIKIAKDLMISAGYSKENPLCFQLTYPSPYKNIGIVIQNMWNNAFDDIVKVSFQSEDYKTYLEDMKNDKLEIWRNKWIGDFDLPSTFTEIYLSNNGCNYGHYSNPECDELYKKSFEGSFDDYLKCQKELVKKMNQDYPSIPLYGLPHMRLVKSFVKNLDTSNNLLDIFKTKYLQIDKES